MLFFLRALKHIKQYLILHVPVYDLYYVDYEIHLDMHHVSCLINLLVNIICLAAIFNLFFLLVEVLYYWFTFDHFNSTLHYLHLYMPHDYVEYIIQKYNNLQKFEMSAWRPF